MNTEEEKIIILGCVQKEQKKQELLYKKYFGYAMTISLSYCSNREEAREIVDDTFMKVFDSISTFDLNKPFKGWFRKITINTAIDTLRKNKKFMNHLDIHENMNPIPSIEMVDQLTIEDIYNMIARLPDVLKVVFNLYEIEGFTHKEISTLLNIPESSSRTYLTRAKLRLREIINKNTN